MSVAFSTSLFGILAAIVMTLVGVFANVGDRRTATMVRIESYIDNMLPQTSRLPVQEPMLPGQVAGGMRMPDARLDAAFGSFAASVTQLQATVQNFESALNTFAATTRDFREFNLHLKDNVQRMSLTFADLSDNLKDQVSRLNGRK